tara:strand:+ start:65 stop:439 length:375 start_codon:yes stop_codon:yes gene_type:complete
LNDDENHEDNPLLSPLLELSTESWRFTKVFTRLLKKLDAGEDARYINQQRYFLKKVEDSLSLAGLQLINLEGSEYDIGMAVSAINIDDFESDQKLIIEQMLEPIVMSDSGIVREGTVVLKKDEG